MPGEGNRRDRSGAANPVMTAARARLLVLQTGALLASGAAAITWYGKGFEGFRHRNPATAVACVALILLYLVGFGVGPQMWRRWRQRRRKAVALGRHEPGFDARYFRLEPYVTATPQTFKREDDAHVEVFRWISETTRPILFLTGASGAGKSSVLEGYVLPMLRAAGVRIERLHGAGDPLARFEATLAGHMQTGGRLVIVYDPFEEFILVEHGSNTEQHRRFLRYVRAFGLALRDSPNAGVCLLLCFRREYLKAVIGMNLGEFIPGETFREIDSFRRGAARAFLAAAPAPPAPAVLERMLNAAEAMDDTPGQFRPVTLNMIGLALREFERFATGEPDRLVQAYLRAALEQREIRDVAPLVVSRMITSANTSRPCRLGELQDATGLPATDIIASLVLLQRRGLVRRLEDPAQQSLAPQPVEAQVWEICHDAVARRLALVLRGLRPSPWPRGAMYGAPVLFALSLIAAVAAVPRYVERQARADLRDQGVVLSADVTTPGGEKAKFRTPGEETPAVLANAIPELALLNVTSLDLSGARGTIPSLDRLTALKTLSLAGAAAPIPSLDRLTALRTLDLSYAKGPIPPLDKLTALHTLSLAGVTGPIPSLDKLAALRMLNLSEAGGSIPPLDKLTALRTLYLSDTTAPALDRLQARGVEIIR